MTKSNHNSKASKNKGNKSGKHKFAKKPAVRRALQGEPVFIYQSVCCQALGEKKACLPDYEKEQKDRDSHLGSWRCSNCKKKCKVTRSRRKSEEQEVVA